MGNEISTITLLKTSRPYKKNISPYTNSNPLAGDAIPSLTDDAIDIPSITPTLT